MLDAVTEDPFEIADVQGQPLINGELEHSRLLVSVTPSPFLDMAKSDLKGREHALAGARRTTQ